MLTTVMLLRTTTAGLDGGAGSVGGGVGAAVVVAAAAAGAVVCAGVLVASALAHFGGDRPQHTTVQLVPPAVVLTASNEAELLEAEQLIVHEEVAAPVQRRSKVPAQCAVMHSHNGACGSVGEDSVAFASNTLVFAVEEFSVSRMTLSFVALKTELGSSIHSFVRQHCNPH
jgi:hypothetical protein